MVWVLQLQRAHKKLNMTHWRKIYIEVIQGIMEKKMETIGIIGITLGLWKSIMKVRWFHRRPVQGSWKVDMVF